MLHFGTALTVLTDRKNKTKMKIADNIVIVFSNLLYTSIVFLLL